jgi:uncharacterized protein (UPF0216 family)
LVYTQNENNPERQTQNDNNGKNYYFDSSEVSRIAEIILENEMLNANEKLYREKDSVYKINRILFDEKINSLHEIIRLKDEQIFKLENTPVQIIDKSWKWWHYTLATIGAITFGFTAGIVYENVNH